MVLAAFHPMEGARHAHLADFRCTFAHQPGGSRSRQRSGHVKELDVPTAKELKPSEKRKLFQRDDPPPQE